MENRCDGSKKQKTSYVHTDDTQYIKTCENLQAFISSAEIGQETFPSPFRRFVREFLLLCSQLRMRMN